MEKAKEKKAYRISDKRIQKRRTSKEEGPKEHHALASKDVGEGAGWEFNKDAGDSGGGNDKAD
jgi:hypothetical protein